MTRSALCERIAFLRRRIAAIEARDAFRPPADWRTGARSMASWPFEGLLQALAAGGFCELVPARPRDAATAAGFVCALALSAAALRRRGVVWITEDMAAREIGLPYGVGLQALGLDPAGFALVRAHSGTETLWAMEEALKRRAVIVAESWISPSAYGLTTSRRLLLAQRRGGGLGLLLLLRASGEAKRLASAAPLRFEVAAAAPQGSERPPPPARLAWRLRIAKARAGLSGRDFGEFDPLLWRDVAFDPDRAEFHAFCERLPASSADGPDFTQKRRASG
jgi:protein ImuA